MVAIKSGEPAERFAAQPPPGIRAVLLFGPDEGQATLIARKLEATARARAKGGLEALRFGSDEIAADPGRLADALLGFSLFGGEPFVTLRVSDGRHNVLGPLGAVLAEPLAAGWIVVEAGDLKPGALRKLFEEKPHAAAIACYEPEAKDMAALASALLREAGKTIDREALARLVERLGSDRLASQNEIEKLILYVGDAPSVTTNDVEAIVGETAEGDGFAAIDAALLGDHRTLARELERLAADGQAAPTLAIQALRHMVALEAPAHAIAEGAPAGATVAAMRPPVFWKRRAAVEATLRRFTPETLGAARHRLGEAILRSRRTPDLADAVIGEALHAIAETARRAGGERPSR